MEKEVLERAARRFLATGLCGLHSPEEIAVACDRLIQLASARSLKHGLRLARRFATRSTLFPQAMQLTAYRALARVTHMSGAHREALAAYRKARRMAVSDKLVQARIDRALIDVYMYLGKKVEAERSARKAIAYFRRHKLHSDLAQTKVNYGNLLHRQDRHREAAAIYREAAEYFATTSNEIALARCDYNLANSLLQLFDVEEAESLYLKAHRMWEKAGCELDACDARYGLAWLHMLTGRLHVAMIELTECERLYRTAGDPRGEALCSLDRAEVYLHLGLSIDALEASSQAERKFRKLKLRYEASKAALFRAQAATALDHSQIARQELARARVGFKQDRNYGFLGVVGLAETDLNHSESSAITSKLRQAGRLFSRSQLPLWQAVCDLKEAAVCRDPKRALARLEANQAARHVPHLFAIWQTSKGDLEYREGRTASARSCWQRAADRLDAVRAQLPPLELRSAYGRDRTSPHGRLVDYELARDPVQAAVWSERKKTAGVWTAPVLDPTIGGARTHVEKSLQMLAGQFASLAHQVSGVGGERGRSAQADTRIINRLKRRIRDEFIRLESGAGGTPDSAEAIRDLIRSTSRQYPILQFHLRDADIVAFVHLDENTSVVRIPAGRTRLISALERWRFILEAELLPAYPGQRQRSGAEDALWEELAAWLWKPLNISPRTQTLVIIPEGELANLPWEALRVNGAPLGDSHYFVLAPSIRHFAAAQRPTPKGSVVEIFRGVGEDLPFVDTELEALCRLSGGAARLHAPATRTDWPVSGHARIWHYSGHAHLRDDNPFYSSLTLADGPLFAVDFRMKECCVDLATLAACRSGEQVALPGEESTGLVRSLLEMGARTVVAGRWPVSDRSAALWMKAFYTSYFHDSNILLASRTAAQQVRELHASAFSWASFAVFGAGNSGGGYDHA